jgi:hypothetical protein
MELLLLLAGLGVLAVMFPKVLIFFGALFLIGLAL